MKINRKNILKYIRVIFYIVSTISMLILKFTDIIHWKCFIKENFGINCPMCGVTRALESIMNLNIIHAIEVNAYVTLILFPIFTILFIDDVISMILKKKSFIEIILGE